MHPPPASNANYGMVALWLFNLWSGKWVGSAMSHLTATNEILLLGEFIWRHIDWTTVTRMQRASCNMQRRNERTIDQSFPCVCASIFLVCYVSSPAPRRIKWINTPTCMSKLFVHLFVHQNKIHPLSNGNSSACAVEIRQLCNEHIHLKAIKSNGFFYLENISSSQYLFQMEYPRASLPLFFLHHIFLNLKSSFDCFQKIYGSSFKCLV